MKRIIKVLAMLAVAAMIFSGCAQSGAPSLTPDQTTPETVPTPGLTTPDATSAPGPTEQPSSPEASTGTLTVLVTDAPPGYEVTSVVVHFSEVWVHKAAYDEFGYGYGYGYMEEEVDKGWIPLTITGGSFESHGYGYSENDEPGWVDLAELRDTEAKLVLAKGDIGVGKYTQLRVIMNEGAGVEVTYEYLENGELKEKTVEAKLPSGTLKFVRPFEVVEDGDTELLLDFDLQKSVVFTGASQSEDVKVIVKPVVKLQVTMPTFE